jgi:uncharacterized protein (DUF736 family)
MECGYLKSTTDKNQPYAFTGEVNVGKRVNGTIGLIKNPRAAKPDAPDGTPDYIVTYRTAGSKYPPRNIGSAWLKHSDKATDFLSITLDDPDWSSPLNLAAFADGEGEFRVVWSRPRRTLGALDNASVVM